MIASTWPLTVDGIPMHVRLAGADYLLAKQLAGYIDQAVPEYRRLPPGQLEADIDRIVRQNLELVRGMLRERRVPPPEELRGITEAVQGRVRDGIPLAAILRACQVGFRGCWALLIQDAVPRDIDHVLAATGLLMQLLENVTSVVCATANR